MDRPTFSGTQVPENGAFNESLVLEGEVIMSTDGIGQRPREEATTRRC
jgi:hypothetical protein